MNYLKITNYEYKRGIYANDLLLDITILILILCLIKKNIYSKETDGNDDYIRIN